MTLFDFEKSLNQLNDKIMTFLDKNGSNPLLWITILVVLFGLAYWSIQYLNRK